MATALVTIMGTSLREFFEFCEEQNSNITAIELTELFNNYFSTNILPKEKEIRAVRPKVPKETKVPKEPKEPKEPRKASGKKREALPRSQQTRLGKDNPENWQVVLKTLRTYLVERGLSPTGVKAEVINRLKEYEDAHPDYDDDTNNEVGLIDETDHETTETVRIKQKGNKLAVPITTEKTKIVNRHCIEMVYHGEDWYFARDKHGIIVGWVSREDDINTPEDDSVTIRGLQKVHCLRADELHLEFETPDNLDL